MTNRLALILRCTVMLTVIGGVVGVSRVDAAGRLTAARAGLVVFPPENVLDHFLCYSVTNAPLHIPPIAVADQFTAQKPQPVKVLGRSVLCAPVLKRTGKHSAKIKFPGAHLLCYALNRQEVPPAFSHVVVANQFGLRQALTVVLRESLCLPTGKAVLQLPPPTIPAQVDHFTCYLVKGAGSPHGAVLTDQFSLAAKLPRYKAVVLTPVRLCAPATKYVHGQVVSRPKNPTAHLLCYTVRITNPAPASSVRITNQFEKNAPLRVIRPLTLCVPSLKRIVKG